MDKEPARITLNLTKSAKEKLDWLAEQSGHTKTAVICQALERYAFLERERLEENAKLQFAYGDGPVQRIREIIFA